MRRLLRRSTFRARLAGASLALVAAPGTLAPRAVLAWSHQGHMATGAIVHDELARTSPALVAEIVRLMAAHPERARFEATLAGATGAARTRRLFELMARWPDDARGGPFDHPEWHYAVRVVSPVGGVLRFVTGEAEQAFGTQMASAARRDAPAAERAVALCWIMHLAGDIQQPLHTATWVSLRFPRSDRAGTVGFVRAAPGGPAMQLHAYWDDALDRSGPLQPAVDALAAAATARFPRAALAELAPGPVGAPSFRAWMDEGVALARSHVYRDEALDLAPDSAAAPVLAAAYGASARALALRRLALAGYRIADALRAALAGGPA
jgi:hypothetical protein